MPHGVHRLWQQGFLKKIIRWGGGGTPVAPLLWETLIAASASLWMHHWYHKWQSYDVQFLIYGVGQAEFFVILDYFLSFYPPNNLENQNFEKWKKKKNPGDIIIFQVYQKWQSYDVWFLRYETKQTEFFCHCGPFLPFYLTNNPKKLKFWKNENTHGGDIILKTQVHQKLWWYAILFLRYSTLDVIIFHFWLFFAHSLL